jgi:hypothetical protein
MAGHPSCRENIRQTHEACYRNRMQQVVNTCRGISVTPAAQRAAPPLYHQAAVGQP